MKVKYFTLPTHSFSFDHELPTSGHEPTSKDIFDNRRGRERVSAVYVKSLGSHKSYLLICIHYSRGGPGYVPFRRVESSNFS